MLCFQAHGPLETIYDVSVKDITTVQLGQVVGLLKLFMSHVSVSIVYPAYE